MLRHRTYTDRAMRRAAFAAFLATAASAGFALAGCGGGSTSAREPSTYATGTGPPTTEPTTTATTATRSLFVYFLRDGRVAAARVSAPETKAVATAALAGLIAGPDAEEQAAGLTSAVSHDERVSVTIAGGVATLAVSDGVLSLEAQAQLVYTLTQFPTVQAVELGGHRLTRKTFEDVTPAILVESPTVGETISSPLRIYGTANTFEATFLVKLLLNAAGQSAFQQVVTATSGSGTRGTFDVTIPFTVRAAGPATLVAFEESAENGRPIHQVEIPVFVRP